MQKTLNRTWKCQLSTIARSLTFDKPFPPLQNVSFSLSPISEAQQSGMTNEFLSLFLLSLLSSSFLCLFYFRCAKGESEFLGK